MLRSRMASLNVAEWSPEQVADWLTGLGPSVARYVPALRARKLNGARLLALRCDDLDSLGVYVIGHQELMLEAVEHLRNFQYELRRECVQQLAVRVSVVATGVARALRHCPERLDTQTLADVARAVTAVKPLACWLHRWSLAGGAAAGAGGGDAWRLGERAERLLRLALEAATCAQRDRFADQPARDLRRNATATAAAADCIIQDVSDPLVLRAASLDAVTLRQGGRPLGFTVLRSCCAHHHLTDIRFGSPAHASGLLYPGDEIVQVDGQCVVGWDGAAVTGACAAAGAGDLSLRVRRRAPRPCHTHLPARTNVLGRSELTVTTLPLVRDPAAAPAEPPPPRAGDPADSDSDALSPPASPDHTHPDHTRMYPPKPHALMQRRHSVCGGSPVSKRPHLSIEQFWQELQERRAGEVPDWGGLYRRDKAVSCSTGLQLSPRRPRTALGMAGGGEEEARRGRLDKSHSTPAYGPPPRAPPPPPPIPESPASSIHVRGRVAERLRRITDEFTTEDETDQDISLVETVNPSLPDVSALQRSSEDVHTFESPTIEPKRNRNNSTSEEARRSDSPPPPPPRPSFTGSSVTLSVSPLPALRPVPRNPQTETVGRLKPVRGTDGAAHISPPLRTLAPPSRRADVTRLCDVTRLHDVTATPHTLPRGGGGGVGVMTASTPSPLGPTPAAGTPHTTPEGPRTSPAASVVRGIFPSARSRDLKKNNSLLAKRRMVSARSLAARGGVCCGAVWQRVRAAPAAAPAPAAPAAPAAPRWVPRHLLLAHSMLYAFRDAQSEKADCMIYLEGFTASAATEVKSRAHAFKVYNQSSAFYFACASREATAAWLQLIHRATLLPSLAPVPTKHFSETDYSETESDSENPDRDTSKREKEKEREKEREKDKDKGKFGSLKKFRRAHASQESVAAASLDRKYLRFFSRHRTKDDSKQKAKQGVPIPTEHYRSYRRAPPSPAPASPAPSAPSPAPSTPSPASPPSLVLPADARCKKLPKPINYIHASNPNLVDFEKSDICARLSLRGGLRGGGGVRGGRRPYRPENFIGLTLEEFMLKKQEEERRQVYTNRVLMGVERGCAIASAAAAAAAAADVTAQAARVAAERAGEGSGGELQERLRRIVPDVIYGELPSEAPPPREPAPPPVAPRAGRAQPMLAGKPISIKGKDGYEKIVYPEDLTSSGEQKEEEEDSSPSTAPPPPARPHPPYSLKRNHKVHSGNTPERPRAPLSPPAPPQDRWARGAGGLAAAAPSGGTVGAAGEAEGAGSGGVARLRLVFAGRSPDQDSGSPVTGASSGSEGGGGGGGSGSGGVTPRGMAAVYPHLQCPPTFQPETYCLARLQPRKHP